MDNLAYLEAGQESDRQNKKGMSMEIQGLEIAIRILILQEEKMAVGKFFWSTMYCYYSVWENKLATGKPYQTQKKFCAASGVGHKNIDCAPPFLLCSCGKNMFEWYLEVGYGKIFKSLLASVSADV